MPLVADHKFILATRDTGYRSPAAAVAELIDNALQAGARHVALFVSEERDASSGPAQRSVSSAASESCGRHGEERSWTRVRFDSREPMRGIRVAVLDDGDGMDGDTLLTALQFGGSTRFGDRGGAGRFGMGLPNSSVSQARRLEVYSWQHGGTPVFSYLDVDEIASGQLRTVPEPTPMSLPAWVTGAGAGVNASVRPTALGHSGTLVVWLDCDRLPYRKASTFHDKLRLALGRLYRHVLRQGGARITINGEPLGPADPLLESHPRSETFGAASRFGEELRYELKLPSDSTRTSTLHVRFSLLPVRSWAWLPLETRRDLGVIGGAGVSVVRAGREIDFGWYFMGAKRKENYDDWWRCEVRFDPALDEYFGVTHSKQGITPHPRLLEIMCPDMEQIARSLNARVRTQFRRLAKREDVVALARAGGDLAHRRPPRTSAAHKGAVEDATVSATRREGLLPPTGTRLREYRIVSEALMSPRFFEVRVEQRAVLLILNTNHPFHERVYAASLRFKETRYHVECTLLAAARAELAAQAALGDAGRSSPGSDAARHVLQNYCEAWSDALAAFVMR